MPGDLDRSGRRRHLQLRGQRLRRYGTPAQRRLGRLIGHGQTPGRTSPSSTTKGKSVFADEKFIGQDEISLNGNNSKSKPTSERTATSRRTAHPGTICGDERHGIGKEAAPTPQLLGCENRRKPRTSADRPAGQHRHRKRQLHAGAEMHLRALRRQSRHLHQNRTPGTATHRIIDVGRPGNPDDERQRLLRLQAEQSAREPSTCRPRRTCGSSSTRRRTAALRPGRPRSTSAATPTSSRAATTRVRAIYEIPAHLRARRRRGQYHRQLGNQPRDDLRATERNRLRRQRRMDRDDRRQDASPCTATRSSNPIRT